MRNRLSDSPWASWTVIFLASLALYTATASRDAQWQDSGEFILRITTGDLAGRLGLALIHPLHYWLGRLAIAPGLLPPAFAVTLVSSVAGALAVANVYGALRSLAIGPRAAVFAAASLALANTFWHLATIAEVYTISAALLSAECWCMIAYARGAGGRAIWGMCLLNGLGLANHLQAMLTLPVVAALCLHAWRHRRLALPGVLLAAGLWILGSLPYTALVARELARTGDLAATLHSALFGKAYAANVLNTGASVRMILTSICFPLLNFPNLLLPAAFYGIWRASRIGVPAVARRALLAVLLLHAVFALRYNVIDQHTFFLPMYVLLTIFGGMGAAAVLQWPPGAARRWLRTIGVVLLLTTPLVYVAAAAAARHVGFLGRFAHHKPYRDDYTYLLIPWSRFDHSAEQMSSQAVRLAGSHGLIVVEDSMAQPAIEYMKLRDRLPDLDIVVAPGSGRADAVARLTERIREAVAAGRPVVLVPLDRDHPRITPPDASWKREGDLYILAATATARSTEPAAHE